MNGYVTDDGVMASDGRGVNILVSWDDLSEMGIETRKGRGMQKYMKTLETFEGDMIIFKYNSLDSLSRSKTKERDNRWKYYKRISDHRFKEIMLDEEGGELDTSYGPGSDILRTVSD